MARCARLLLIASALLVTTACPPAAPIKGEQKSLTIFCDGRFRLVVSYTSPTDDLEVTPSFVGADSFASIASDPAAKFTLKAGVATEVTITGKVKDCTAGLGQLRLGDRVEPFNITVPPLPFRTIAAPSVTARPDGTYSYTLKITCCNPLTPGMKRTVAISAGTGGGAPVGTITPTRLECPTDDGKEVTLSGRVNVEEPDRNSRVIISEDIAGGVSCSIDVPIMRP